MALNLKTLGVRSLSGAVFVALLLGSVLWNYLSFTAFFFVAALLALNEFYKIAQKLGAQPYKFIGFASAILLYVVSVSGFAFAGSALEGLPALLRPLLMLVPILVFTVALFSKRPQPFHNAVFTLAGIVYVVLPFALAHRLVITEDPFAHYDPYVLLGIIFLIWSNDTFAYLGGSLMGRNKMIERISPGKTWEGTVFGVLVTFGISFLVKNYLDPAHSAFWPAFGVMVPVLATIGDLVESMLKRQAGVKDSGNIMPGHGGALDRFDSLIFVLPFAAVFILFF